ncbi:uncharacterized protein LACBIDRAFT_291629 [Laccaria bicolor S238N-H82]|uniref:Predicted protein n=1 Tax=Laccaria bicolor (strain S238N-H82 / ATCC MYA-4686) TaxID=486041 RepID=B0CR19_LACBS|nr:uncharacterized protein LACBIDRAFT_291629 [Laccaria bicolor S238N-H82]EDR15743.1 predicted protein [Laccaria bicolor S238N-H82]|eukprot:XP_001873951.1 predicted protein [Laccaria bicolor S238N-H82]
MAAIPAPTLIPREEWLDADFDLPEGALIHASSDKDDEDEDWDLEMNLSRPGGAKARAVVDGMAARLETSLRPPPSQAFNIRPPLSPLDVDEEDDEGVSTIKVTALSHSVFAKPSAKPTADVIDEDFEDAFSLPSDLTQLSLAPLSLNHRSSKNSLEWGDKDNSSSSQSSDAYSTLGFAEASPSSNSTSSVSLPEIETEDDDDGDQLEGLVIPASLFESKQSGRQLTKLLETKKKAKLTSTHLKVSAPNPEDDFETGLIIDDDVDLSPSRLMYNAQHQSQRHFNRSNSMPPQRPSTLRPPSRHKLERAKSPANPPTSSARQLQKLRLSPSPPLLPPSRSQTYQSLSSALPSPPSSSSFLSPKPGSLRGQKSHSRLKPPTPPATTRKLTRKASLSFLMDSSSQASGSGLTAESSKPARYEEPTAASRAKTHKSSTSRLYDFTVPPTRPSTPSSNPAALRLTLPTQSRLKSRPALSQVFGGNTAPAAQSPPPPPIPPRPPSSVSLRAASRLSNNPPPPSVPKLLRRPKRQRTYGDGTELDGIDDLPTDREKEGRFRVQPKAIGNRIPGASYPNTNKSGEKPSEKGTIRRKGKRDGSATDEYPVALAQSTNTLRRTTTRIDFLPKSSAHTESDVLPKRKKNASSPSNTRRKPTLIRNLGGTGGPKVVGDMKWNPHSLRWEGNDQVLRDFDAAVGTSTRPALITQLTGSSIGSPAGSFASGARVVGNMFFDPVQEDEPDVFANLADDEEDGAAWESKGGTIRASVHQRVSDAGSASTSCANSSESSDLRLGAPSPAHSHTRTLSESGSERGSRASMVVRDVDETFLEKCRDAEERHRVEMKGWKSTLAKQDLYANPDRSHLYEIRALATRKY